jgi:hypothetical protein
VRRAAIAATVVAVLGAAGGLVWVATSARADDAGTAAPAPHPVTTAVAAGRHDRLDTDHGPVHVWAPAGYHADGAATVVYVHGYYTDVDQAWAQHQLPEQFALAGINAVFVACKAPRGSRQDVAWRSLGDLLQTVHAHTGLPRPMGPVVVVGHSGAYRTLLEWLDYPLLDTVVLLDALYAEIEPFRDWVLASPRRRLIDVSEDTIRWSEELWRDLTAAGVPPVALDRFPDDDRDWPDGASDARVVAVRAQFDHMAIVTGGVVIPLVLRLVPVEVLPDAPWREPIGQLPPPPPAKKK